MTRAGGIWSVFAFNTNSYRKAARIPPTMGATQNIYGNKIKRHFTLPFEELFTTVRPGSWRMVYLFNTIQYFIHISQLILSNIQININRFIFTYMEKEIKNTKCSRVKCPIKYYNKNFCFSILTSLNIVLHDWKCICNTIHTYKGKFMLNNFTALIHLTFERPGGSNEAPPLGFSDLNFEAFK